MDDITLKINDAGHDMTFVIEKMSAFKAEGWLIRAGLLLGREAITAEGVKDYRGLVARSSTRRPLPCSTNCSPAARCASGN